VKIQSSPRATHYVRWLFALMPPPNASELTPADVIRWELTQVERQVCAQPVFGPGDYFISSVDLELMKGLPDGVARLHSIGVGLLAHRSDVVVEFGEDVYSECGPDGRLSTFRRPKWSLDDREWHRRNLRKMMLAEAWLKRGWGRNCMGLVLRFPSRNGMRMKPSEIKILRRYFGDIAKEFELPLYNWWELFNSHKGGGLSG